jgi:hypothetical protein
MMNNKGSISKYLAAHNENSKFPPILSFSTSRNQIFVFFCFYFFDIFSQPGAQGNNSNKYQLKPMKDVIGTNSKAFGKTGAGTSELESSAFLIFLIFLRTPYLGNHMCTFSRAFRETKFTSIGVPSKKLCPF